MTQQGFYSYRRKLPHWRQEGSVYFVTFRLFQGCLTEAEMVIVKEHVRSGDEKYYMLYGGVIMPDHAHALLQPKDGVELSRIMKGIKGVSARLLNKHRGTLGQIWQDESWDRIVRNDEEFQEKLQYMFLNPIKKGLCEDTSKYAGWICSN
jgi:putative transposase